MKFKIDMNMDRLNYKYSFNKLIYICTHWNNRLSVTACVIIHIIDATFPIISGLNSSPNSAASMRR